MKNIRLQSGFTIVELLVAMGLGLSLMAGAVSVFMQSNRSALQDEQISIMLDNGRFLSRLIGRELAMAGFWGKYLDVATISKHASVVVGTDCGNGTPFAMDLKGLQVLSDVTTGSVAANFNCLPSLSIVAGSDVFAIKRVADSETTDADIDSGQMYLRTNGAGAQMFLGGGVGTPPALGGTELNWAYLPTIFYLRNFSITAGDNIPTLCRAYLDSSSSPPNMQNECLVDGVEDLQIEFGIDSDGDFIADYYTGAPSAAETTDAVVARIFVLVRSINTVPNHTNDKTYSLGAKVVAPANDGFYRRVFSTTVLLRNPTNLAAVGA